MTGRTKALYIFDLQCLFLLIGYLRCCSCFVDLLRHFILQIPVVVILYPSFMVVCINFIGLGPWIQKIYRIYQKDRAFTIIFSVISMHNNEVGKKDILSSWTGSELWSNVSWCLSHHVQLIIVQLHPFQHFPSTYSKQKPPSSFVS